MTAHAFLVGFSIAAAYALIATALVSGAQGIAVWQERRDERKQR